MPTRALRAAEWMTKGDKRREALALELEKAAGSERRRTSFVVWTGGAKKPADLAGKTTILAPTSYQVKMEDTEGYANADPLWRAILAKPDLPPEVALRAPEEQLAVGAKTEVPLGVDVRDDYGVGVVRILCR